MSGRFSEARAMPIRVLIADDHPVVGNALSAGIEGQQISVVGFTERADEVEAKYEELRPDVLLLDLRFGPEAKISGFDIARSILSKHSDARIVFYSQFDSDEMLREAYVLGASAFIPKRSALDDVINALVKVSTEGTYFVPSVASRMAMLSIRRDDSPQTLLDERELQVFRYLALGLETAEIAEKMGLAPKTITNARQSIKKKLNEDKPARMALIAVRSGVITSEELAEYGSLRH
jgi:two-component system invasion response regulator UvrY